jgi:hypothetical protein
VKEGTGPAPDGNVWTGYDECLAGWQGLASDSTIRFEVEHVDVDGDRAVIRWRVTGARDYGGVNLMRGRDGKVVEALGYGKRPSQAVSSRRVVRCSADRHKRRTPHSGGVLVGCVSVVEQARGTAGGLDFAITADLVDPGRVNILERWESQAVVETSRSSGPSNEQGAAKPSASVTSTTSPTCGRCLGRHRVNLQHGPCQDR